MERSFPPRRRFTHVLRRSNPRLTGAAEAAAMKLTSLLATAAVTLAAAVSAASAAPADQAGAVKADLTHDATDPSTASAMVGNRTLVVIPAKMANDATI